ncbi:DNAH9 [Cordylochernes scorpioides]|uniref:DNAH9 n=1 Tax=Cordylochernes scorpioides TaxID=51811 RepID=A0ABY6KE53_9ARAC|nr:DNAH9 [Cordylochernes scorpioides]
MVQLDVPQAIREHESGPEEELALQEVELKQKNKEADNLIQFCKLCRHPTNLYAQVVGRETEKVSKEQEVAAEEEVKVGVIQAQVAVKAQEGEEDLAKAEPALAAAQMALNTLNKANLTELKSFGSPPPAVTNVTAAVLVLMAPGGQVPKDRSWKAAKLLMAKVRIDWNFGVICPQSIMVGACFTNGCWEHSSVDLAPNGCFWFISEPFLKKLSEQYFTQYHGICISGFLVKLTQVDQFLDALINFDKENIHENNLKQLQPYLVNPEFKPEFITSKSQAAAGLCSWVINIVQFYRVYCEVAPKRRALEEANAELKAATDRLNFLKEKLAVRCLKRVMKCVLYLWLQDLNRSLHELTQAYENAVRAKLICQKQAEETFATISLANRLVNGLASEKVRWGETINQYRKQMVMVPGDVLLVSAYVSYLGPFTKTYRQSLLDTHWLPFLTALKSPIPLTPNLDPLSLLTDDAKIATWNNDGLPEDRMSTENATILINSERWPLIIDPQLQGIKWIKNKFKDNLKVVQLGQRGYLDIIEVGVSNGNTLLIENIGESVDPVLDPIVGQNTIKKGRAIKMGDKEVEYHPNFRLILHTKLANPHYKPELQAQTTLINFTVTRDGLEDQLLTETVSRERPDLEKLKKDLTKQQNDFKIVLKELEDSLLHKLSTAKGDFLTDPALVENLENTKETAAEIEQKVAEAKKTEVQINLARELYRPAAERASMLYFILNELFKINPIYQFSLKAFSVVFNKAIDKAEKSDEIKERIAYLIDSITYSVYVYTTRGLFEVDKLIYISQMTFTILLKSKQIDPEELDFLLRYPAVPNHTSPVDFLSSLGWGGIKALANMDEFKNLDKEIKGSAKRWKKFVDSECPEKEKFPQEWKNKTSLQKLCMMRCLRPDRMTYAVMNFVEEKFGTKYVEGRSVEFAKSFEESGPATPIFFILSPGVDPLKHVEIHGRKLGFTFDKNNFHNVSLGQGQEEVAERALELASRKGHWVILQNVHLVKNWLPTLEKKLEQYSLGSHDSFRVFVSAEPAPIPAAHIIPQGILESSIKITNEPPSGMLANLHQALNNFSQATLEMCTKETEFKSILFSLCYFHAVVAERRKFGPQGWNRSYPFNFGDLTISVNVLYNYLEANTKVPWEDLCYLFGEIMYGGHITDDWDRRLCRTYLEEYMHPDQLDGDLYLAPGFLYPPSLDYQGYHHYVDDNLPLESPYLYGLHPNAEIGFLTNTSENLFRTLLELQPRDSGGAGASGMSRDEKIKQILDDTIEKLPEPFNVGELYTRAEDKTPYTIVALQGCERMNILTIEIRRSLRDLDLGLKGELTINTEMEELAEALFMDSVPPKWTKRAYPSSLGLTAWYADLLIRIKGKKGFHKIALVHIFVNQSLYCASTTELENWSSDFVLPSSVWLAGFFNPQSFLTAIMQSTARKNELPLDKMTLQCDVTKKNKEDFTSPPREGAYINGLYMEGARWDLQAGVIMESRLKELYPSMPVIYVRSILIDKQDLRNMYQCPVYKTRSRGATYVWTFNLRTKEKAALWVLGGVSLILQI